MTDSPSPSRSYLVLPPDDLRALLQRAQTGEDPELLIVEAWTNATTIEFGGAP